MASATRLPLKALGAVVALSAGLGVVNSRAVILRMFTGPGSTSRIIALLVVLANFKNFPFVWHIRVWHAILKHFLFDPRSFTPATDGLNSKYPALFQHTITPSRSPLTECDYNLHKSNSTYFSDLDVSRSHLVSCLLRKGVKHLQDNPRVVIAPDGKPATGKWFIMLGAVECSFKKEIKPYEQYEMWTRVLCWDRKWLYMVTHFVKAGAVRPDGYTLGVDGKGMLAKLRALKAGKKVTKKISENGEAMNGHAVGPKVPHHAIFATAISKYVMKLGRLTIHPEVVLDASNLLPPKPGGWNTMSGEKAGEKAWLNGTTEAPSPAGVASTEWDWKRVEAENARGLQFGESFAALEGLHEEFTGEDRPVLGVYGTPFE